MLSACCVALRTGRHAQSFARASILAAAFVFSAAAGTASLAQTTGTAVEYYHAAFNHYFVTASPGEIADIDGGKYGTAWVRTGCAFPVWLDAGTETSPTCRFWSRAFAPRSSHFYTPIASECEERKQDPTWTYESIAFHLRTSPLGTCPSGTSPLYRAYNDFASGAPNHRYSTSRAVIDQMAAQGWVREGNGPDVVFACVPAPAAPVSNSGYFEGMTARGEELLVAMYDDGSFYLLYASDTTTGIVDGMATFSGSAFAAAEARDLVLLPNPGESPASVSGSVVPRQRISGTIASAYGTRTFSAAYEGPVGRPVQPGDVAGAYDGIAYVVAEFTALQTSMVLNVSGDGRLSGSSGSCTADGALYARGTTGLFDATVMVSGCPTGQFTSTGFALYESASRGLIAITVSADATRAFMFIGLK